jgi:hypothetical protein
MHLAAVCACLVTASTLISGGKASAFSSYVAVTSSSRRCAALRGLSFKGFTEAEEILAPSSVNATNVFHSRDFILIRFFSDANAPVANQDVTTFKRVTIAVDDSVVYTLASTDVDYRNALAQHCVMLTVSHIPRLALAIHNARVGTLVKVTVDADAPLTPATGFGGVSDFGTAYGWGPGIWFPSGTIVAWNLKTDKAGAAYAALPINGALGRRFTLAPNTYLGLSIIGSAALTAQNGSDYVTNGHVGLLGDWNGFVYLGATYMFSFKQDQKDPGLALVLGAGPQAIAALAGKPK